MTNAELCKATAKVLQGQASENLIRVVLEALVDTAATAMADGDEVKIKGLGTLYPSQYNVWKGDLEFGHKSKGGKRVRVRFRPFDSTNIKLTENWSVKQPARK